MIVYGTNPVVGAFLVALAIGIAVFFIYWQISGNRRLHADVDQAVVMRETQRVLSSAAHEGQKLLGRLNAYQAYEEDEAAASFWKAQAQAWTDWVDGLVHWRLPHLRSNFANDADRDAGDFIGTAWQHHLQTWLQVRMKRLNEFVQGAAGFQGPLGPQPERQDPPAIPDPPQPSNSMPPIKRAPPTPAKVVHPVTAAFLIGLYKKHTTPQADALMDAYLGRWIRESGRVIDVSRDRTRVNTRATDAYVTFVFDGDATSRERVTLLNKNDRLTAVGRIQQADSLKVTLVNCELESVGPVSQ